jgi:hypothetical protein
LFAQNRHIDSLNQVIKQTKNTDTNKVHALVDLAAIYYHDNLDTSQVLINEALKLSKKNKFIRGEGFSNTALSGYFFQKGELDSALIYANKGAKILESINDKSHVLAAYNNMALVYNNMQKPLKAIEIYLKIFDLIKENKPSVQHMAICNNLAVAYGNNKNLENSKKWFRKVKEYANEMNHPMGLVYGLNGISGVNIELNELDEAIDNSLKSLVISEANKMDKPIIESYQNLGKAYHKKKLYELSNKYLLQGKVLAEKIGVNRNLEVIYQQLANNYEAIGQYKAALKYTKSYYAVKDSIFSESKVKLIEELEKKYETVELEKKQVQTELEKEQLNKQKELSDIKANRNKSYFIMAIVLGVLIVGIILFFFYQQQTKKKAQFIQLKLEEAKRQLKLEQQSRESELTALRSQMNPHFVFNALNSIQEYIITNNKDLAGDYLGLFADLMRRYLKHSQTNYVLLDEEIETLDMYLQLEKVRFEDTFDYYIKIDEKIDIDDLSLPVMVLQPFVENAIKHGLLHKQNDRKLWLEFFVENGNLKINVIDNGIGRERSSEINSTRSDEHKSYATSAIQKRIELLNQNNTRKIAVKYFDLESGTKVEILINL